MAGHSWAWLGTALRHHKYACLTQDKAMVFMLSTYCFLSWAQCKALTYGLACSVSSCRLLTIRTGQERTGQDRTGQDRTGQNRTGQDKTRQDKTGQTRHDVTFEGESVTDPVRTTEYRQQIIGNKHFDASNPQVLVESNIRERRVPKANGT